MRIWPELTVVFALSLLVRVVCVAAVFPAGYFLKYPALVDEIRGGLSERAMDGSFLYIAFHWLCRTIFGPDLVWARGVQIVLGSLNAALLSLIGARLFGRRAGLLSGCFAGIYSGFIVYDNVFEPETVLMLLTLGWITCMVPGRPALTGGARTAAAGLLFGLAVVTRPTVVLALPFAAAHIWRTGRRGGPLGTFLIAGALPIAALLAYNWKACGRPTLITMSPGQVFYEGNNPNARGVLSAYPLVLKEQEMQYLRRSDYAHPLYRQIARSSLGPGASLLQCNDYWLGRALGFVRLYPRAELAILHSKLRFLLSEYEAHDVEQAAATDASTRRLPLLRFGFVAALGIIGAVAALRNENGSRPPYASGIWIPYVLAFCFALANMVFFVSARQRLHVVPYLILFGGVFADRVVCLGCRRELRAVAGYVVLGAALYAVLAISPTAAVELERMRVDSRAAGEAYRSALHSTNVEDKTTHAVDAVVAAPYLYDKFRPAGVRYDALFYARVAERARSRASGDGGDVSLLYNAAIAELIAGDCDAATRDLESVVESGYAVYRYYLAPSSPHHFLALCAERSGRADDALLEYASALAEQPGSAWSLSRRADLLRRLGRTAEAAADLETLDAIHDPATVHLMLGTAAFEAGDWDESASHFRALSVILPDYMKARVFLMASLERAGDPSWRDQLAEIQRFGSTLAYPEASYPR
ncbi:MAG: glycosyltransferase family 39 protein [Acidobacteria bacterium]|nr:glycosyltransferase family 39 protein [Acidobacteriota bacterium]